MMWSAVTPMPAHHVRTVSQVTGQQKRIVPVSHSAMVLGFWIIPAMHNPMAMTMSRRYGTGRRYRPRYQRAASTVGMVKGTG
jgi:hypothetical protein